MKYTILVTIVVFIGSLALTASACGEKGQENSEQQQKTVQSSEQGQAAVQMKDGATVKNGFKGRPAVGTKAVCPVMGNEFAVTKDSLSSVYKGKTYVFCCPGCKPQFDKNPGKYVKK